MKTLKKLLFIIMAVAVLAMPVFGVQAAESDIPVTEQPGVSPTPSPVPIRELVTKGNKIYYYYKGKMVKNKWKRYNGYKYYFGANGNAVRGGQRINNVVYVFDEKGRLFENKQNKIVKSGSNIYHIRTEHGRASIGYFIYKNNLYYADPKGRLYQKKSRQNGQLYFTNSGAARKDYNALLKMRVMQIVSSITNSGMSQSQKLYACWKYVVYGGFYYGGPDPNIYQSGWARSEALRMFRAGYGNGGGSFLCESGRNGDGWSEAVFSNVGGSGDSGSRGKSDGGGTCEYQHGICGGIVCAAGDRSFPGSRYCALPGAKRSLSDEGRHYEGIRDQTERV